MKRTQFIALAAIGLLAACSHSGARNFSMNSGTPASAPEEPASEPAPEPQPAPPAPPGGTLTRTTETTTGILNTALHVTGNTVLGLGDHTDLSNLPVVGGAVGNIVQSVDGHLNSAAQVQVVGLPVLGASTPSGNQAIGISALSTTPSTGTIATVGVLNQGSQQQPVNVNIGGAQILGNSGPAAVTVGVLNPAGTTPPAPGRTATGLIGNVVTTVTTPLTGGRGGR